MTNDAYARDIRRLPKIAYNTNNRNHKNRSKHHVHVIINNNYRLEAIGIKPSFMFFWFLNASYENIWTSPGDETFYVLHHDHDADIFYYAAAALAIT